MSGLKSLNVSKHWDLITQVYRPKFKYPDSRPILGSGPLSPGKTLILFLMAIHESLIMFSNCRVDIKPLLNGLNHRIGCLCISFGLTKIKRDSLKSHISVTFLEIYKDESHGHWSDHPYHFPRRDDSGIRALDEGERVIIRFSNYCFEEVDLLSEVLGLTMSLCSEYCWLLASYFSVDVSRRLELLVVESVVHDLPSVIKRPSLHIDLDLHLLRLVDLRREGIFDRIRSSIENSSFFFVDFASSHPFSLCNSKYSSGSGSCTFNDYKRFENLCASFLSVLPLWSFSIIRYFRDNGRKFPNGCKCSNPSCQSRPPSLIEYGACQGLLKILPCLAVEKIILYAMMDSFSAYALRLVCRWFYSLSRKFTKFRPSVNRQSPQAVNGPSFYISLSDQ